MRKVRANDLIPGRNERNPVRIDGFRRPKFEKKNNYARAESGFCITYSERSQIRRRVLRPVLAETAREHVSRAMSETSASCSLITHVCLLIIVVINLRLFQWRHHLKNQNCTRASATWISTKTKKQKKVLLRRSSFFLSLLGFFYLITLLLGISLSPVVGFPLREGASSSNDAPIISSPSSSSSNEDEEKGCSVLFRSFSDRQNTKERSTTINNLFEKRSSFSSRFNCCRYRVRFIPTKKPQKQSHLSLCTEEEEGE